MDIQTPLSLPRFDYSINLLEAVLLPFVVWAVRAAYLFLSELRDEMKDLRRIVGRDEDEHPTGLVRAVREFSRDLIKHRDALRDAGWLERRTGIDRRISHISPTPER